MITLSGSRVFFSPSPSASASSLFFLFSSTLPHFRGQLRAIIAGCLSGFASLLAVVTPPFPPPSHSTRHKMRFFVLFVVNFLVVVLSVACNLFVYFWRRLHQIRQCRQAEFCPPPPISPLLLCHFCYACFLRLSVLCEFFKTLRPNGVYLTFCRRFWPLAANALRY